MAPLSSEAIAPNPNPLTVHEASIKAWPSTHVLLSVSEVATRGLAIARAFERDRADLEAFYTPAALQPERAEQLASMVEAMMELDRRHAAADGDTPPPLERARAVKVETSKHLRYAFDGDPEVTAVIDEAQSMRGNSKLARSLGRLGAVCKARWPEVVANSRMSPELLEQLIELSETLLLWEDAPAEKEAVADMRRRAASMAFDEMSRVQRLARFAFRGDRERQRSYPNLRMTTKPRPRVPVPEAAPTESAPEQPSASEG